MYCLSAGALPVAEIRAWSRQYDASRTEGMDDRSMSRLMEWLPNQVPENDDVSALVHGDFRIDNMILHPTEPTVAAVLDWEL